MPAQSDATRALDLIQKSGFMMNADCKAAHEIAQAHEGERIYDAIHALVHRIEGDQRNAAYWDRAAGTDFGGADLKVELQHLRAFAASEG